MLLAFNETDALLFADSPDANDIVYASFSVGFDLSDLANTLAAPKGNKATPLKSPMARAGSLGFEIYKLDCALVENTNRPCPLTLTIVGRLHSQFTMNYPSYTTSKLIWK